MQELRDRFGAVAQAAAEAAYFSGQDAQGGVLAHLTAKLAAKLKVLIFIKISRDVHTCLCRLGRTVYCTRHSGLCSVCVCGAVGPLGAIAQKLCINQWL